VVDFWIIHGLGHDYPGGDPAGSFTDPAGPDVTTAAYTWFLQHKVGQPCARSVAYDGAFTGRLAPRQARATLPATGGPALPTLALLGSLVGLAGRVGVRRSRARPSGRPAP
jgi:hypothetical protein